MQNLPGDAATQSSHSAPFVCFSRSVPGEHFCIRLSVSNWPISAVKFKGKLINSWLRDVEVRGSTQRVPLLVTLRAQRSAFFLRYQAYTVQLCDILSMVIITELWLLKQGGSVIMGSRYIVFLTADMQRQTHTWCEWGPFVCRCEQFSNKLSINGVGLMINLQVVGDWCRRLPFDAIYKKIS